MRVLSVAVATRYTMPGWSGFGYAVQQKWEAT
jgi:hypothetical protein